MVDLSNVPVIDDEGNYVSQPTGGTSTSTPNPGGNPAPKPPVYQPKSKSKPKPTPPPAPPTPPATPTPPVTPAPTPPVTPTPTPAPVPTPTPTQPGNPPSNPTPATPATPTPPGTPATPPKKGFWKNVKDKWTGSSIKNDDGAAAIGAQVTGRTYKTRENIDRERLNNDNEYQKVSQLVANEQTKYDAIKNEINQYKNYTMRYHLLRDNHKRDPLEEAELKSLAIKLGSIDSADLTDKERESRSRLNALNKTLGSVEIKKQSITDDENNYQYNVQVGRQKYDKENSGAAAARNFLGSIGKNSEALTNSLTAPKVGMPDVALTQTSKSISGGLNEMFGGIKLNQSANDWTKTSAGGGRGFVDSIVNVRSSGKVTPFGTPGTVDGSDLASRYSMSTPAKKITVGDVSSNQVYRIALEDVRRNKKTKKVAVKRKKSAIISIQNLSLGKAVQSTGIRKMPLINGSGIMHINTGIVGIKKPQMNMNAGLVHVTNLISVKKPDMNMNAGLLNVGNLMSTKGVMKNNVNLFNASGLLNNINKMAKATKIKKRLKVKV